MSYTVTAVGDDTTATVTVTVTNTGGEYPLGTLLTLQRLDPATGLGEELLAQWRVTSAAADNRVIVDAAVPLQRESQWRLLAALTVAATSGPVTVTAAGCWLTSSTGQTLPVELQAWPADDVTARQTLHKVIGRRDVVAVQDVWDLPAGELTFLARTLPDVQAVTDILTGGGVVLLRTQPDSAIYLADDDTARYFFTAGNLRRSRLSGVSPDGRRLITVTAAGSIPFPTLIPQDITTLGELAARGTPLSTLAAQASTLGGLAALT